ncbi:MAG: putative Ig domain-containing protein [Thermoguttaceae bacterium]|jgi:hypothetical protein
MRPLIHVGVVSLLASGASAAVIGEPKKPYQDRPDDKRCEHREEVNQSPWTYRIELRGTVDGTMTRMPIGYSAFVQGWQPNRSVLIENVGSTDVRNPRIVVNGKRNWSTLEDVVAEAARGYTSPADKARAIWEHQRRQRFHACTWDEECDDVLKVLNVYGYTLCGNEAHVINDLWKAAGLSVRRGYPVGHVVCEVFYDGDYHLLDSDEHVVCLERDNKTIASCTEIVRDHDLVKRTHTYGIGQREDRKTDEFSASLYSYEGERKGDFGNNTGHSMDLSLRPGESIEFRWDHAGKEYSAGTVAETGRPNRDGQGSLNQWGGVAYDNLRNGRLCYRPDLGSPLAERGAALTENILFDTTGALVRPVDSRKPSAATWQFASPYVFVGGKATTQVRIAEGGRAGWSYSADQKTWQVLASAEPGTTELAASLDEVVSPRGKPTYRFWLRLELAGPAEARALAFASDIQTSLLGLPELELGGNQIAYTDACAEAREVRITHQWLERTAWRPPHAPPAAISPGDGRTVAGSRVAFRWQPAADPDGDAIVDYHFELSEHADMRWPLSPNFEKRTSLTPAEGKPEWTVPQAGLLNPDTTYYWRARALDATGVWGPFSKVFQFRVEAPGVPLDVKLASGDGGGLVLQWRPNPAGQAPVAYKVYGSDEKGFSASDGAHRVNRGKGFCRTIEEYESKPADSPDAGAVETPGNLIARVVETSLEVVGADLALPNTNRAFYRVVAVGPAGAESGPSDYAEVPRPFVAAGSERRARLGEPYRYQPVVIRSIGDLRCRRSDKSSYNAAFWDQEEYTFEAAGLPDWLTLDPATGALSGKPAAAGAFDVSYKVIGIAGKTATASFRLVVDPQP